MIKNFVDRFTKIWYIYNLFPSFLCSNSNLIILPKGDAIQFFRNTYIFNDDRYDAIYQ